jgi:hypothetical protein
MRMAGDAVTSFLGNPAITRAAPFAIGAIGAASQLGDANDNAGGNLADAGGYLGGSALGSLGAGAGIRALGAAIPPAGPWGAALKAALMIGGSLVGGEIGKGVTRGAADVVTGGATSNTLESQALRLQQRQFDQGLNQRIQEIAQLMPIQKLQGLQAAELDKLVRDAAFERMTAANFQSALWQNSLAQSARSSDMVARGLNNVLNV